jgi:hypothetical protein
MLITCTLIAESRRMSHTGKMFGTAFPFRLEPTVYAWAERLSPDYRGGYWHFYHLDNGAFYMAPASDHDFSLSSPNGFTGRLSPEAFGIVICLLAYSQLCFGTPSGFTETCAEHFHRLRDYALAHREAQTILIAID